MPMTWQSLQLLKQNLGDVGEGVTAYLKGRQEEARRQKNFEALNKFTNETPEMQGMNKNLLGLLFNQNYDPAEALKGTMAYQSSLAPASELHTQPKTGAIYEIKKRSPIMGGGYEPNPQELIPGQPDMEKGWRDALDENGAPKTTKVNGMDRYLEEEFARPSGSAEAGKPTGNYRTKSLGYMGMTEPGTELSDDQLKILAQRELSTGGAQKPMISMRDLGTQRRYNKIMTQVITEMGGGENAGLIKATYDAHAKALKDAQQKYTILSGFELGALKNLDLAEKLAAQYPRSSLPTVARFQNWYAENLDNNPKYTAFENALYAGVREYAKVATGNIGATGLTDEGIRMADKMANTTMSAERLGSAIGTMRKDMANATGGWKDTIMNEEDMLRNLTRKGGIIDNSNKRNKAGAPPPGAHVKKWNPQTKRVE